MLVPFVEIVEKSSLGEAKYQIREVFINPDNIVSVKKDDKAETMLREGKLPWDLHEGQSFSRIVLSSAAGAEFITVVGEPEHVVEKCLSTKSRLLKG